MINLEKKVERILRIVEKHQEYLTKPENLPQLAKIMVSWQRLLSSLRVTYGFDGTIAKKSWGEANPKYYILDSDAYKNEKIKDLVYDAWCVELSNNGHWDDPWYWETVELGENEAFLAKPNKTMKDWRDYFKRSYPNLVETRRAFESYMLVSFGTGRDWNDHGCIDHEGPSDNPEYLFGYWRRAVIEPTIKAQLDKIFDLPEIKAVIAEADKVIEHRRATWPDPLQEMSDRVDKLMLELDPDYLNPKKVAKREREAKKAIRERALEEEKAHGYYSRSLCKYSPITRIPDNIERSYLTAVKRICKEILNSEYEDSSAKKTIRKIVADLKKRKLIKKEDILVKV